MFDFFKPKSPPIIMDGGLPPAPSSVASLSCVSDAAHNNIDDERRNGSTRTIVLFPTQACTDIQESSSSSVGDNNGSNRRQETALATRDGPESLEPSASDETHITCVETRRSSGSAVLRRNNNRPVLRREEGEERYPGVSMELVIYEDPWKIKKKLKPSDLGHLWRLLLPWDAVRMHVLQWMGEETVRRVKSQEGMEVAVRDVDTGDEHRLVFRHWTSSNSYLLNGDWNWRFVQRRGPGKDDEIGMLWDTNACVVHFTVLRRAACGASNAAA